MFLWFNFWNILNVCFLNPITWIGIITFGGHHAFKFGIIYSNGGHIGFNYTHTSFCFFHNSNVLYILTVISSSCSLSLSLSMSDNFFSFNLLFSPFFFFLSIHKLFLEICYAGELMSALIFTYICTLEPRQRRPTQCFNKIMANLSLRGHVTLRGHVSPKSLFSKL